MSSYSLTFAKIKIYLMHSSNQLPDFFIFYYFFLITIESIRVCTIKNNELVFKNRAH